MVRGWINRGGYNLTVAGDTEIAKTLRMARMMGIPALATTAEGTAQVDLQIAGPWTGPSNGAATGFAGPQVTGTVKLRNVHIAVRGSERPVEIVIGRDATRARQGPRLEVECEGGGTASGMAHWRCRADAEPGACPIHFTSEYESDRSQRPHRMGESGCEEAAWYRVLEPNAPAGTSLLASLRASGHVTAEHLQIHGLRRLAFPPM